MSCTKQLTLSESDCALDVCATLAAVDITPATIYPAERPAAFASEYCYCLVLTHEASGPTAVFNRYDFATNTLIPKDTIAGPKITGGAVYDSTNNKFVCSNATGVSIFDPVTETIVDSFGALPTTINLIYVPLRNKVYGTSGSDVVAIDVAARTQVSLGTIGFIGAVPSNNFEYSPLSDSLYWANSQGIRKWDLGTNTEILIDATPLGLYCVWDSTRSLLVVCADTNMIDVDTGSDTVVYNAAISNPLYTIRWTPFYSATLQKVFAIGQHIAVNNGAIFSYEPATRDVTLLLEDYLYTTLLGFSGRSCISTASTGGVETVRKLCLVEPPRLAHWPMEVITSGNFYDCITNIPVPYGSALYGFGGLVERDFVAGKVNNAFHFYHNNPGYNQVTMGDPSTAIAALKHDGLGFSLCAWIKINSYSEVAGVGYGSLAYFGALNTDYVQLKFKNGEYSFIAKDRVVHLETVSITLPPLGSWFFVHMFQDVAGGKMGIQFDNGAITYASFAPQSAPNTGGLVQAYQQGAGWIPNDWIVDEITVRLDKPFTVAQLAYLYNSGAGRTCPITLP